MQIHFEKWQGTGNDFIIIDNRDQKYTLNEDLIQMMCSRKYGIGSDGLIELLPSSSLDFKMVFYNPDGSLSFCGNGARCAVAYALKHKWFEKATAFEAFDGVHLGKVEGKLIAIKMNDIKGVEDQDGLCFINTGAPHIVTYVNDLLQFDVFNEGRKLRYSNVFNKDANINFIEEKEQYIRIRTYEKGVENETLSCGTGVTAAALSFALKKGLKHGKINVLSQGGDLFVRFELKNEDQFKNIWLSGPVKYVFEGNYDTTLGD